MTTNKLDTLQQLMVLTMEECGELIQRCSKCIRKDKYYDDKKLLEEVGDVYTMIELMHECDIIMLDNMSPEQVKEAVKIINKRSRIEISGNIGLSNIQKIASEGIDYISVGALTHSTPTVDISMVFD